MDWKKTGPEFAERFRHFAFDEVVNEDGQQLPGETRYLAILATLIGCGGVDAYEEILPRAMENGVFSRSGIALPLPGQATTTMENRLEKGVAAQAAIFGDRMKEAWKQSHINRWLADNCFGDYYTRTGLDLKQREMITFCFLMAQGGCEPQLTAHAKGNMNLGNDAAFLTRVVSQCLPYIGYPRSLNAIACIRKAEET